jgi:uncharacterized protein
MPTNSTLTPTAPDERIHALDIIRGFALFGILLMNVEWFTRPLADLDLGLGIDPKLSGMDYAISWLIYVLVQGKFWTLFSLLFGMGFAVMLARAEETGRAFFALYLRRIIGLFLFGSAHFVLIWAGDILHNYAIAAFALLLVVTRNWRLWLAVLPLVLAAGLWLKSGATIGNVMFLLLIGVLMLALAGGAALRYVQWGVALYSLPLLLTLTGIMVMSIHKPVETPEEVQQRTEQLHEYTQQRADEVRVATQGSFGEEVQQRAEKYVDELPKAVMVGYMALAMFLIGFGFVRSGIVNNLRGHLPWLRRMAAWTIPLGLVVTAYSLWLHAPTFAPHAEPDSSAFAATALFTWAALPLSIGYFAALVLLAHTRIGARLLSPLRAAGQMALSNYIGASLIGTLFFYGYGLGGWGQVSRLGQMVFVLVVFALQVVFSHVWMKKFRFGPLEWLWRSFTYWRWQPLLRAW